MKKNIFKFFFQCFGFSVAATLISFPILFLYLKSKIDFTSEGFFILKTIFSLNLIVFAFIFSAGLFSFFVQVDSTGVRKNFFHEKICWSDIASVRIVGFSWLNLSRRLILSGPKGGVEINMFIFDDQETVLEELKKLLPWTKSLQLNKLPSDAKK